MKLSQKLIEERVNPYFAEWENLSSDIAALHKQRKKGTEEPMNKGVQLFKRLLVHCKDDDTEKAIAPLNGAERLAFIEQYPGSFAAFRQLDELFTEMKKTIAMRRIQLKRQKNPLE